MAKYQFPLTRDYLPDWHIEQAIRELISNGIDGEVREGHKFSLEWARRNGGTLILKNEGTKLEMGTLLMGYSESRKENSCIGTHGEGSLLAYLVFAREEVDIKVINNDESWVPYFEYSEEYNEDTLWIKTHALSKTKTGAFSVEIRNVTKETYETISKWFLKTHPTYDPDKNIEMYDGRKLLMQFEFGGAVYVKGVFICNIPDLRYGYNLDMDINRDRNLVSESDAQWYASDVLNTAMHTHPERFEDVSLVDFLSSNALEAYAYKFNEHSDLVDKVVTEFEKLHGENAVPVLSVSQCTELEHFGMEGIIVSPQLKDVVESKKGIYEKIKGEAAQTAVENFSWSDLSGEEKENLVLTGDLIQAVTGSDILDRTKIVRYLDKSLGGRHSGNQIEIAKNQLVSLKKTLNILTHELAHDVGSDGERSHGDKEKDLLLDMVIHLLIQ